MQDPVGFYISPDGRTVFNANNATSHTNCITQLELQIPFELSSAVLVDESNILNTVALRSGGRDDCHDVYVSPDGRHMSVTNEQGAVYDFDLPTPFSLRGATINQVEYFHPNFNQTTRGDDVFFSHDGSKMFLAGRLPNKVFEYSLSTNFDISTATYSGNVIDVSAQITEDLFGFEFNNDGTMMYISDTQNNGTSTEKIYQYSLSKSFDFSSGATLVRSVDLEALHDTTNPARGEREPAGMHFTKDGLRLFVVGTQGNDVNQ